jgi:IS5 family transposase
MSSIIEYGLREAYNSMKSMDKLVQIDPMIDWESLRPMVKDLYSNNTDRGGRPNIDEIVMIKTLFLQSMYNCSDEVMERELHDRISFRNFMHYPKIIPDSRTIWLFRERLSSTGKDKVIWNAIWKQLEDRGISIKKGTVQDATFVETDPGKHGKKKPPVPVEPEPPEITGDAGADISEKEDNASAVKKRMTKEEKRQAKIRNAEKKRMRRDERRGGKTRRSRDGTWTKKNNTSHFGNKLHTLQGTDLPLIREFVVTTASLHDSKVDLSITGIPCYKDKGYAGAYCRDINATMDKASREHPLTIEQIRRNFRITRKRSPGERPYSVMKGIMNGGHTFVTMVRRYRVKAMFLCLGYNMLTLITLKKQGRIA